MSATTPTTPTAFSRMQAACSGPCRQGALPCPTPAACELIESHWLSAGTTPAQREAQERLQRLADEAPSGIDAGLLIVAIAAMAALAAMLLSAWGGL